MCVLKQWMASFIRVLSFMLMLSGSISTCTSCNAELESRVWWEEPEYFLLVTIRVIPCNDYTIPRFTKKKKKKKSGISSVGLPAGLVTSSWVTVGQSLNPPVPCTSVWKMGLR